MSRMVSAVGLLGFVALFLSAALRPADGAMQRGTAVRPPLIAPDGPSTGHLRILAVGDVNLGRSVGQAILGGDTVFPFAAVADTFAAYDVVFANLESCLSEQKGETQDPALNLVFTGPPAGAWSLKRAGVNLVSTANNHALDYGLRSRVETMRNLDSAGIAYAGTSPDSSRLHGPALLLRRGVRIGLFACTDIMNREGDGWKRYVADADTGLLLPKIRAWRDSLDLMIVSFHGGGEYAERPSRRTRQFAQAVIDAGADLFLGHHPHVPYGIESHEGKLVVHSLGNFVFRQPARYWTQHSYALSLEVVKDSVGTRIREYHILPVRCGLQPTFVVDDDERAELADRVRLLSTEAVAEKRAW
jgi:poly-gamma-glutamate capsule biosynthesis protein CapA/YwtB (metallophosphatase superfamily)